MKCIIVLFLFSLNISDEFGWKSYPADLLDQISPEEFSKLHVNHQNYYYAITIDNKLQYRKTKKAEFDTEVFFRWAARLVFGIIIFLIAWDYFDIVYGWVRKKINRR